MQCITQLRALSLVLAHQRKRVSVSLRRLQQLWQLPHYSTSYGGGVKDALGILAEEDRLSQTIQFQVDREPNYGLPL
jgi:hypothetical protein